MKVMITGAGGQLGRALQSEAMGYAAIPLTHAQLDITDFQKVRRAVSTHLPDIIINAAAYTNVDGAEKDQSTAYRLNATGPRNLAMAALEKNIPVVQVSTDYVFDGLSDRPYDESDQPDPQSVYGRSKLGGEEAVAATNPRHYIVRTAWLYANEGKNFPLTMLALASKEQVRVVNDQYGSPTYAPHLARAIYRMIGTGVYGTYHLAGNGAASWFELAHRLYEMCGIRTRVIPVSTEEFPRPARRPRFSVLTTIQDPQILLPPWEEGLADFVRGMKSDKSRK